MTWNCCLQFYYMLIVLEKHSCKFRRFISLLGYFIIYYILIKHSIFAWKTTHGKPATIDVILVHVNLNTCDNCKDGYTVQLIKTSIIGLDKMLYL